MRLLLVKEREPRDRGEFMKKIRKILVELIVCGAILWAFLRMIFYPLAATFFFLRIGELTALQVIVSLVVASAGLAISLILLVIILIEEGD